jgi:hypothetical protein
MKVHLAKWDDKWVSDGTSEQTLVFLFKDDAKIRFLIKLHQTLCRSYLHCAVSIELSFSKGWLANSKGALQALRDKARVSF